MFTGHLYDESLLEAGPPLAPAFRCLLGFLSGTLNAVGEHMVGVVTRWWQKEKSQQT